MKKNKVLIALIIAHGAIAFNSCKKANQQNPQPVVTIAPGITANVDGVVSSFNINASAGSSTVHDTTSTGIFGSAANGDIITIGMRGKLVAGKTYSTSATPELMPFIAYTSGVHDFSNDDNSPNKISITIKSVTADSVSGTFTGGLIETFGGGVMRATKSITNGKFNVRIY